MKLKTTLNATFVFAACSILTAFKFLFNQAIPLRCMNCKRKTKQISAHCTACYSELPFQQAACSRCGQSFAANQDFCGKCLATPPKFDACFCAFRYEPPISQQLANFKYNEKPEFAKQIAATMAEEIENNNISLPELLIPVPMHISKLRERGYNQSLLLTKALSKLLNIPYSNKLIHKRFATKPQMSLNLKARLTNVRGSFCAPNRINAKHIAIVDDVLTTGATTEEIAKLLKKKGVDYVQVWGFAHKN